MFEGNHSFLYDINTTNAIRKLLADISEPDVNFLSDRNDQPRFAFGHDEHFYPMLFRRDDATGTWNKLDQKNLGSHFVLAKYSPTQHADKIKILVLLVHGKKDKTTQLDQAEMIRDALIKAGNAPEWMLDDIEGHGFYDSENRKKFYEKLEAFLAMHIGK